LAHVSNILEEHGLQVLLHTFAEEMEVSESHPHSLLDLPTNQLLAESALMISVCESLYFHHLPSISVTQFVPGFNTRIRSDVKPRKLYL
jgi:hypothetical protein